MTKQRKDEHGTEFSIWVRKQPEIDSKLGYVATDLDYVWHNYKTGEWMLIEEKRHDSSPTYSQRCILKLLHNACKHAPKYRGLHLIVFENTSPDDGRIYLDKKEITREQLLQFLMFFEIEE